MPTLCRWPTPPSSSSHRCAIHCLFHCNDDKCPHCGAYYFPLRGAPIFGTRCGSPGICPLQTSVSIWMASHLRASRIVSSISLLWVRHLCSIKSALSLHRPSHQLPSPQPSHSSTPSQSDSLHPILTTWIPSAFFGGIQEAFLQVLLRGTGLSSSRNFEVPGYSVFRVDRTLARRDPVTAGDRSGGKVLALIGSDLSFQTIAFPPCEILHQNKCSFSVFCSLLSVSLLVWWVFSVLLTVMYKTCNK